MLYITMYESGALQYSYGMGVCGGVGGAQVPIKTTTYITYIRHYSN